VATLIFKFDMEAFIPYEKGCLLDCLDWVPNRGRALMLALSGDVTRCLRLAAIKLFVNNK